MSSVTLAITFLPFLLAPFGPNPPPQDELVNLLSLQEGTLAVVAPSHYGGWPTEAMLDESPASGWACEEGKLRDGIFVFELVSAATLESFGFDTNGIDSEGAAAREVLVEVSTTSQTSGFTPVLEATLAAKADGQRFAAQAVSPARWVRLTIRSNHGSEEWTELFSFKGFGKRPPLETPPAAISGTYGSDYSKFHVLQKGTALSGCYEYNEGVLDGTIEGRIMKITWREGEDGQLLGPAVMVFAPDGQSFRGYFWHAGNEQEPPAGSWSGEKESSEVGECPHWSGSVEGELKKSLAASGRARLYGILFDLDSSVIRPESKPVLDEVLALLQGEPSWRILIEGHTDATGSDAHNQDLSEGRAASIRAYLEAGGIDGARLSTVGHGETRPVADNATELGRAQNRRVELVRR